MGKYSLGFIYVWSGNIFLRAHKKPANSAIWSAGFLMAVVAAMMDVAICYPREPRRL
jgi:hypothetical protein